MPLKGAGMEIVVEQIKELNSTGNLKAFAKVNIGGKLKIHGCRIILQPGQKPWVSLPKMEWTGKDGKRRYYPVIEVPQHVENAICEAILRGWKERRQ